MYCHTYIASIVAALWLSIAITSHASGSAGHCAVADGVSLQVLGSGGPVADDNRASSGYLLWVNGRSRILTDTGGGVFLRFGEAGARFEDLSLIALSHFHTDHSADLPALLKSGFFSSRNKSLSISGPGPGGGYPSLATYLDGLIGSDHGAYGYLSGYLDGSDGLVRLETKSIDAGLSQPSRVYLSQDGDLEVFAIGVPHGPVPALAYRIRVGQKNIVFSGDHNGSSDAFIEFARGADVLVMHMPVPEGISGVGRRLHAPPGVIGEIAAKTGAGKLVLSHFMARSLKNLQANLTKVKAAYSGPIIIAQDLQCIEI